MRLDRAISLRLGLSRKAAAAAIRRGRVAIGGATARDPGAEVGDGAEVTVDGEPLPTPLPDLVLFHKPLGVHSTVTDPWGRPCLGSAAAALLAAGLHPVGRLDAETDGLLPFSRDGALTQWLLHPRRAIVRVYRATVSPPPGPELGARLAAGVETAEGTFTAALRSVDGDAVVVAVTEGKHRMVRRMLANAGHPVLALRRLSFGALTLGDLPAGAWRAPDAAEAAWLARRGQ